MTASSTSRLLVVSVALCVAAGCHRHGSSAEQQPSSDPSLFQVPESQRAGLNVVAVHTRPVTLPVDVPAVVNFNELKTSRVVPLVSGRVASVQVHEGDSVQAGQTLMIIASPDSSDTVASLARDRSSLQAKKVILVRDQDLYAHKAISLEELQQAELDVTASEATVRDDQAHVAITGGVGSQAVVRAPIAGVVVSRSIAVGESVQAGSTECFTITDPTAVWVMAQLYQEDLRQVAKNDVVIIRSPVLVTPLKGIVSYVGASIDTGTLTIPVRIAAGNPDGLLKKGMYVSAEIVPSKAIDTIVIPAAAVVRDEDNLPFVYVEASPGSFARRHVELGPQVEKDFAIDSGLADGDRVLADGAVFAQFVQSLSR